MDRWVQSTGIVLAVACAWGASRPAQAAPIETKAFGDFPYQWTFDETPVAGSPLSFDSYHNTTAAAGGDGKPDWYLDEGTNVTHTADGRLVIGDATKVYSRIWPVSPVSLLSGYTIEYKVKAISTRGVAVYATPAETHGLAGIRFENNGENTDIYFGLNATDPEDIKATVPADEDVIIRVVGEFNDSAPEDILYTLYVNGELIETGLQRYLRSPGTDRILLGDPGSRHGGILEVDYIGYTPGTFAPLPEPASVALLTLGGALMVRGGRRGERR